MTGRNKDQAQTLEAEEINYVELVAIRKLISGNIHITCLFVSLLVSKKRRKKLEKKKIEKETF